MTVAEGAEAEQVAAVSAESREPVGHQHLAGGRHRLLGVFNAAQDLKVVPVGKQPLPAEVRLALTGQGWKVGQGGKGFAEVGGLQRCNAPGRTTRHDVQRPGGQHAQPAGAKPPDAIHQRGAHDAVVCAAGLDRPLATQLAGEKSAFGVVVQPQGRGVNEAHAPRRTGFGQCLGHVVVNGFVALAPALAQDAHAVDHHVNVLQMHPPVFRAQERLKSQRLPPQPVWRGLRRRHLR